MGENTLLKTLYNLDNAFGVSWMSALTAVKKPKPSASDREII